MPRMNANKQSIKQVAWVGDDFLQGPIRGVVLEFHGLGGGCKWDPDMVDMAWAKAGGLVVHPYYGPWSWMNRPARAFVDELVDAIYAAYGLADSVPLISTGGSMGGQGTLLYTRYARRPIKACLALFPVCDLVYHFGERADLPPTILYAMRACQGDDLQALLREHSPLHQVAAMPSIPYLFIHGDKDQAVSKEHHSDPMVAAMRARKMDVEYMEIPGMGHGSRMPLELFQKEVQFVTKYLT